MVKIVNFMISQTMGGIEQAFLDYNSALLDNGFHVLDITDCRGLINQEIVSHPNLEIYKIRFNKLNLCLVWTLYQKFKKYKPDLIIVHNKKAIFLVRLAAKLLNIKVVGVAHNPKIRHLNQCDAIFSITEFQKELFIKKGFDKNKIFVIPNMITLKKSVPSSISFHKEPVIGVLGRFDPMKGFPDFIDACHILKEKGISFHAVIGGDDDGSYPQEKNNILNKIEAYQLHRDITLLGWIKDKEQFFNMIDIFVLPSHNEPFGIVLLEAMMFAKPIISSDAEGPSEIFSDTSAALIYPKKNATLLAQALERLINDKEFAQNIAFNGYKLVNARYTCEQVGAKLRNAVMALIKG